jgi:hypothetical protein
MQTKRIKRMKKKVMKFLSFSPLRNRKEKTSVAKSTSKSPTKKLSKDVQKTKDVTKNLSAVSYF